MRLAKYQRHTIYIILLAEAENPMKVYREHQWRSSTENGFCWMWKMLFETNELYGGFKRLLPELYSKRNFDHWQYWFDWNDRISALEQCIAETAPALIEALNREAVI